MDKKLCRIAIVGISGAGKTSLAKRLAATLSVMHVELDALYWHLPSWQIPSRTAVCGWELFECARSRVGASGSHRMA